jgi:hypothetical protein
MMQSICCRSTAGGQRDCISSSIGDVHTPHQPILTDDPVGWCVDEIIDKQGPPVFVGYWMVVDGLCFEGLIGQVGGSKVSGEVLKTTDREMEVTSRDIK